MAYITPEEARQRFIPKRRAGLAAPSLQVISFDKAVGDKLLLYIIKNETSGMSYLTPADGSLTTILGEWNTVDDLGELPESMLEWFSCYESEIEWWQKEGELLYSNTEAGLVSVVANNSASDGNPQILFDIKWHLNYPYNSKLTYGEYVANEYGTHWKYTGCPATALSLILAFWGKKGYYVGCKRITPYTRKYNDDNSNEPASYSYYVDVDLPPKANFDFPNMLNTYTSYIEGLSEVDEKVDAVATLMLYAATALHSRPSYTISNGKKVYSEGTNATPKWCLGYIKDKFYLNDILGYSELRWNSAGYNTSIHSWSNITSKICDSIDKGMPVMLSGMKVSERDSLGNISKYGAGHTFVCHGYRTEDDGTISFYINWGYNGSYDNWFKSTALYPSKTGKSGDAGYNALRSAIVYIKPKYHIDNITEITIANVLRDVGKINSSIQNIGVEDINYDETVTLDDAEALAEYVISDADRTDPSKKKTFKLASIVSIGKSCREILNSLEKLGYT